MWGMILGAVILLVGIIFGGFVGVLLGWIAAERQREKEDQAKREALIKKIETQDRSSSGRFGNGKAELTSQNLQGV